VSKFVRKIIWKEEKMTVTDVVRFYNYAITLCNIGIVNQQEFENKFGEIGPTLFRDLGMAVPTSVGETPTLPPETILPPTTEALILQIKAWVKSQVEE
jgi:hypothetical protein